jgi:hypothetical protein
MFGSNSFQQSSQAYQAGYQDGSCGRQSSPKKFPGQEDEYCIRAIVPLERISKLGK